MYAPYIKQEEPLKTECQHFLDCIRNGVTPVSCGVRGTELVRILEASSASLRSGGSPVDLSPRAELRSPPAVPAGRSAAITAPKLPAGRSKKSPARTVRKTGQVKIVLNGNGH
jgi:hypothetical protein